MKNRDYTEFDIALLNLAEPVGRFLYGCFSILVGLAVLIILPAACCVWISRL